MPIVESEFAPLRNPRLAALATSAWPAWLWSADASRILWANAVGAAIFGAANTAACQNLRFAPGDGSANQVVRLAATLPTYQARLERLRGFGAAFGGGLICSCARIALPGGATAILLAATEPRGPVLTLEDRVRRLYADGEQAVAVFAPDGALIYATEAARGRFNGAMTLSALGIGADAAQALEAGAGSAASTFGPVDIMRLGEEASRVLAVSPAAESNEAPAAQPVPETITANPAGAVAAASSAPLTETPPAASPPGQPPSPQVAARDEATSERRHPLRFVWKMDEAGRFVVGSDEFIELVGPRTMAAFGRQWNDIVAELKLDPENTVTRAVATHETWSGIVVQWPVDGLSEQLPVELSGLPVFDRDRSFRGYRGFGVCRDIDRINQLARARRERPIGFMPMPETPRQDSDDSVAAPPIDAEDDIAAKVASPPIAEAAEASEASGTTAATAAEAAPRVERPALTVAPGSANVVPFRPSAPAETKAPSLSPVERKAFRELAQELTSRLRGTPQASAAAESALEGIPDERSNACDETVASCDETTAAASSNVPVEAAASSGGVAAERAAAPDAAAEQILLDRIPVGVLVYRHDSLLYANDSLLYANRRFLEWSGYESLDALAAAGGLTNLFVEPGAGALAERGETQPLSIMTQCGEHFAVGGRLFTIPWNGASALALILTSGPADQAAEHSFGTAESENREFGSILDLATDGIVVLGRDGRVIHANAGAGTLFGKAKGELAGNVLTEILAPASQGAARDYLDRIARNPNMHHDAIEVETPGRDGRPLPLAMTLARTHGDRFCAIFHDGTARRKVDEELRIAKRETQKAAAAKADFLAKVSHEIRTPLNAMTGFAEVIMAERFGPIGNERYREYLKDIHDAGTHLVSLLNDLLDLSKIETGQLDLTFANVNLNDLTQQCVGIMQPQANRARIIIRSSLIQGLPQVVADERSLRQIVLNLLANAIKFTGPGGQVIVSTAFADNGEAVLRVRDTGIGMSEKDVEAAMTPFRHTATAGGWGSGNTGLGLPLTKALAEANRANFSIKSAPNAGTLVEIAFPPTRVLGD